MIRLRKRRRLGSSCSSWFLGTPASAPGVYCRDPVPVGSYAPRHERRCAGSQIDDRHLWFHSRAGNSMFESQGKSSEWGSQLFQFIDGDSEFNSSNRNQSWV
jgi:hypothetical protein